MIQLMDLNIMENQRKLASQVKGLVGTDRLNWMGNYNYDLKKKTVNIFFFKENDAKKAILMLNNYSVTKIYKTPKWINIAFKFSISIILENN